MSAASSITHQPKPRRVWARAFILACTLHAGLFALMIFRAGSKIGWPTSPSLLASIDSAKVQTVSPDAAPAAALDPNSNPKPESSTDDDPVDHDLGASATLATGNESGAARALEPNLSAVKSALGALLEQNPPAPTDQTYADLARKARVLEQISTPAEVARMSAMIRVALDLPAEPPTRSAPAIKGPFNFDQCLILDIQRVQTETETRIVERLRDPDGRGLILETIRRVNPESPAITYESTALESGKPLVIITATKDDFTNAESRHRPYALIDRFPLVKQLHDQAVLPLLSRFGGESRPPLEQRSPPTSQPAPVFPDTPRSSLPTKPDIAPPQRPDTQFPSLNAGL